MPETTQINRVSFACPKCKHPVGSANNHLHCSLCDRVYPITNKIPDFLSGDSEAGNAPVFDPANRLTTLNGMARKMDRMAHIYESNLIGTFGMKLLGVRGSRSHFVNDLACFHSKTLEGVTGTILDIGCGPATYSRRTSSSSRNTYGIDISMGMLRKAMAYANRDRVAGMHLARARVEELPFGDSVFAGAICSGSLHLFPDPAFALREIARTMKAGAPLSGQTFVAGKKLVHRLVRNGSWFNYELGRLKNDLTEAGFGEIRSKVDGIILTFSARKA